MDESNATCGLRLKSIGLENTEENRQAYRTLLCTTPGIGEYVAGAILFEETLFQNTTSGESMVDTLNKAGVIPGIKVDKVSVIYRSVIHTDKEVNVNICSWKPSAGSDFSAARSNTMRIVLLQPCDCQK